jgi:hypothetical protein
MMHVPVGYRLQLRSRYAQDETFYDHPNEEALILQALIRLTYNMSFTNEFAKRKVIQTNHEWYTYVYTPISVPVPQTFEYENSRKPIKY